MLDLLGRTTAVTHEDVFIARYHALVLTALRITDGDRAEAEDLVHEAFMRFTLVQPPLDEVQHLDAYLSRMLRNMYTSRIRRRQRASETSLSILDYDSLDIGFHAIDASRQLEVCETLRAACEYGCLRKRSSKTGGVFLLRFFHGYLPSEIASLTRLSSAIVDALVFRARREVKGYIEHPEQLAFIGGADPIKAGAKPRTSSIAVDEELPHRGFMDELRARIFTDTHQRCWSKKTLREVYADRSAQALSRGDLADLVGCPVCLDAVNALLGLPRLADRWPVDTLGPGSRGGPPGGGGSLGAGPASTGTIASGRRRTRAVFEHRPRELRISVNGFVLGSHTVSGDTNELTLSVNLSEPIALIELLSE
jgi:RNA polymerase sigma factor (sigma-70 family)